MNHSAKSFRVMISDDERKRRKCGGPKSHPDWIAWGLIEPHREQAMINHSQTLERLNERGGLSVVELYCVLNDLRWRDYDWDTDYKVVGRFLFDEGVRYTDEIARQATDPDFTPCRVSFVRVGDILVAELLPPNQILKGEILAKIESVAG